MTLKRPQESPTSVDLTHALTPRLPDHCDFLRYNCFYVSNQLKFGVKAIEINQNEEDKRKKSYFRSNKSGLAKIKAV